MEVRGVRGIIKEVKKNGKKITVGVEYEILEEK